MIQLVLVGAVGIEPTTFGLKVCLSLFPLFGISDLHSGYSVELRLFGLFWGVFRTFSVPICTEVGQSISPKRHDLSHISGSGQCRRLRYHREGF